MVLHHGLHHLLDVIQLRLLLLRAVCLLFFVLFFGLCFFTVLHHGLQLCNTKQFQLLVVQPDSNVLGLQPEIRVLLLVILFVWKALRFAVCVQSLLPQPMQ